jgi:hypothetical protein
MQSSGFARRLAVEQVGVVGAIGGPEFGPFFFRTQQFESDNSLTRAAAAQIVATRPKIDGQAISPVASVD